MSRTKQLILLVLATLIAVWLFVQIQAQLGEQRSQRQQVQQAR